MIGHHLMRRSDFWDEMHPLESSMQHFEERGTFWRIMSPLGGILPHMCGLKEACFYALSLFSCLWRSSCDLSNL